MGLRWYVSRLRAMSPAELAWRVRDRMLQLAWRRRQVRRGDDPPASPRRALSPGCTVRLERAAAEAVPVQRRDSLLAVADQLLEGHWTVLGVDRHDLAKPDWFLDPLSGRRAPQDRYAFAINHRSEAETGNVKQVWELSRHHHLTVLAAAWFLSTDDRYADMVASQLQDWWDCNPFLSGVHWTSGIEVGIRLISWTWVRRLLDDWPGVADLFERNERARRQVRWHQQYLDTFKSVGSSANNHVIAEAAGQLVAACGLPWFPESDRWRKAAAALLERELAHNTFPSGVNRELASSYHGFVAELGLLAAVEAGAAGHPLGGDTLALLCRMFDVAAALVDEKRRPPRQGDGDDARTLLVDDPHADAEGWSSLLAAGASSFGALPWWPEADDDVRSHLLASLDARVPLGRERPTRRRSHFDDAGITLLRTPAHESPEIWCRCDGGSHGFLSTAAHAHADALSIEVRHGGVDILADPGTYCYHGEPAWRSYFRSTGGHNTLEVDGCDQSRSGGAFLWLEHAASRVLHVDVDTEDGVEQWSAEHEGYTRLKPPLVHRRRVTLDCRKRVLTVTDALIGEGRQACRLVFHCGPAVDVILEGATAVLRWGSPVLPATARMTLPGELEWTLLCGSTAPIAGWYSSGFGTKEPSPTLVGTGTCNGDGELQTVVRFATVG